MKAEKLLEIVVMQLQDAIDRTELTYETCSGFGDVVLVGQKELAEDILARLHKAKQECDDPTQQAMEELEEELLSNSGRFCINGNCEE